MKKIKAWISFLALVALVAYPSGAASPPKPKAIAGENRVVEERSRVTLDGSSSSDAEKRPLRFLWTQIQGPAVSLADVGLSLLSFEAPDVVATTLLGFDLRVENGVAHDTDRIYVAVLHKNRPPSASFQAAPAADRDEVVALSAAESCDPDGDVLSFLWLQDGGPLVHLSNPDRPDVLMSFGDLPRGMSYPTRVAMRLRVSDPEGEISEAKGVLLVTDTFDQSVRRMGLRPSKAKPSPQLRQMEWTRADAQRARRRAVFEREWSRFEAARSAGQLKEARALLPSLLSLDPTDKTLHESLAALEAEEAAAYAREVEAGHQAFRQRDYLAAIQAYRQAESIRPMARAAGSMVTVCMAALEDAARSLLLPAETTAQRPRDPEQSLALYSQGLQFYVDGRLQDAINMWRKAVELNADNRLAVNALHRATTEMGKKR